jgi:hypothetical protein
MSATVPKSETKQIELCRGDLRLRLSVRLGDAFVAGELVRLAPEATFSIEGADDLSATYGKVNWFSGVASGALFAFRTLQETRRVVYVEELTGRLGSADMPVVADAAARAVAGCLHADKLPLDSDGWDVIEPVHADGAKASAS